MRSFFGRLHRTVNRYPLPACALYTLLITLAVESVNRGALFGGFGFLFTRPFSFFLNYLLLLCLFFPSVFLRRRYAYLTVAALFPLVLSVAEAVLTHYRGFPLLAGDFLSLLSGPEIIFSYLTVPQFVLACIALCGAIFGLVLLLRRMACGVRPTGVQRLIALLLAPVILAGSVLTVILAGRLDTPPIEGYRKNGLCYSLSQSLFHNGMARPDGYGADAVAQALSRLEAESLSPDAPNLIYIQLESFTAFSQWKNLHANQNPSPFFDSLWQTYPHGYVQIDKVGYGTSDTEFEILTAMNIWDAGISTYPYNSVLQKRTCESVASVLSRYGYATAALHNNSYGFYSRHKVYSNLGFDAFYSSESMQGLTYNSQNWAKDEIFAALLPSLLAATPQKDFLFGVTVQGHGNYPAGQKNLPITVTGASSQKQNERLSYYFSQISETDAMLRALLTTLESYPEPVTVLLYGDHLPGIGATAQDLVTDSLYHTPYVLWSNRAPADAQRRDFEAYELTPWIFDTLGIRAGALFRCRQGGGDDAALLTYDILFGAQHALAATPVVPNPNYAYGAALHPTSKEGT